MSDQPPQPIGTPDEQTVHREPAPTVREHNQRMDETHPYDRVGRR